MAIVPAGNPLKASDEQRMVNAAISTHSITERQRNEELRMKR